MKTIICRDFLFHPAGESKKCDERKHAGLLLSPYSPWLELPFSGLMILTNVLQLLQQQTAGHRVAMSAARHWKVSAYVAP